ncbi:MAG: pitrilysin family protein [Methylococcales bacterium]
MRIKLGIVLLLSMFITCVQAGPVIQQWTSSGGAKVLFVRTQGLPMVDIQVLFSAGSAYDGDKYGVASLTSALLDTGAGEWNVDQIAERMEGVGAQLGSGSARDSAWVTLRSLTEPKNLDIALATLHAVITSPQFTSKDFNRDKKRVLVGLKQQEESPEVVATIAFFNAMYGDHPYAHPTSGTIESVGNIQRDDLVAFHKQFYVSRNALVVMVGDVTRAKASAMADSLLDGLPEGAKAPDLPPIGPLGKSDKIIKRFPSAQTHIQYGMPVVQRQDPDYFPLYVGNHILGGSGFVSRVVNEIREKRGLAYSASSYFSPMTRKGPFIMGLQTRNDQAEKAYSVLTNTLQEFIDNGPTEKELVSHKKNITGGFVLRIDSNSKLSDYLAMIGFYGLPLDYLDKFSDKVNAVTRRQIKNAFKRRVQPENFRTVMVGGA